MKKNNSIFNQGRATMDPEDVKEFNELGRFPANFIYTGCEEVFEEFDKAGHSKSNKTDYKRPRSILGQKLGEYEMAAYGDEGSASRYFQDINNLELKNNEYEVKVKLLTGDALDKLKKIPDNFVDSIVTDPPAGISFMGKEWDHDKGGRNEWISWLKEVMIEAKRTLKPGGHCFVWALPRTSHWTATALEDAGFEIRDVVTHVFGSGFPKSLNISKAIDKQKGLEREVVGTQKLGGTAATLKGKANRTNWYDQGEGGTYTPQIDITKPASDEAKQWEGWGSGLKPAAENWILCRKPLSEKTIADNVLKWGVGGINIDGSRIDNSDMNIPKEANIKQPHLKGTKLLDNGNETGLVHMNVYNEQGRFPANFIHDGSDELMKEFDKAGKSKSSLRKKNYQASYSGSGNTCFLIGSANPNNTYGDEGSAARFFYCSKASGKEKNEGLEDMDDKELKKTFDGCYNHNEDPHNKKPTKNNHPTVKPVKLMTYLINMITPPDGIVLDPFMGSGSTGVAAVKKGFNFIGIEMDEEYMKIAKARIDNVKTQEGKTK